MTETPAAIAVALEVAPGPGEVALARVPADTPVRVTYPDGSVQVTGAWPHRFYLAITGGSQLAAVSR